MNRLAKGSMLFGLIFLTSVATASWFYPVSLEEYRTRSDVIAEFEVVDKWSAKKTIKEMVAIGTKEELSTRTRSYLFYKLRTLRPYKGVDAGNVIRIRSLGGVGVGPEGKLSKYVGPLTYELNVGQEVLVFARYEPLNNEYIATSQSLTVFKLIQTSDGRILLQSYYGTPPILTNEEVERVKANKRSIDEVQTTLREVRELFNEK